MPELRLAGCRTRPLLGYLKGLGVLRVVARQADPDARARWSGDMFELSSALDHDTLCEFLLERCAPTPVVSPWNGGSGFFASKAGASKAVDSIERSADRRLLKFGEAITLSREALERFGLHAALSTAAKNELLKEKKVALVRTLRAELADDALEWLDTALVLFGDRLRFAPLLGLGGGDGNFDLAGNYAIAVADVLLPQASHRSAGWLEGALWAHPTELTKLSSAHLRRDTSPVNSPLGKSDDALGNPWDLVLAIEGSLALAAGAARRYGASLDSAVAAPFTVGRTNVGYGSAVASESGREELWLPIWTGWAGLPEFEVLAREGRAQVGRRTASSGLDFVRAIGELGVARGIESFERFVLLERAGRGSHLSVPVGRIDVRPRSGTAALRSIDGWLERLLRYGRGRCPAAHGLAIRRLEAAAFAFADASSAAAAAAFVERLGEVETVLASSGPATAEAGLSPLRAVPVLAWLDAADDGTPEFAAAAAIASLHDRNPGLPAVRDYLHGTGLDERGTRTYAHGRTRVPRLAAPVIRLAALHARRHRDAGREAGSLPFEAGIACPLAAARAFVAGELDDQRILRLALGLSLFDYTRSRRTASSQDAASPQPAYELLALAGAGTPARPLSPRPGWIARLSAGVVRPVIEDAHLRLTMAGLVPLPTPSDLDALTRAGERLAAALLLRLGDDDRERIARALTRRVDNDATTEGVTE